MQAHRHRQFGELGVGQRVQVAQQVAGPRFVAVMRFQRAERVFQGGQRLAVGLQILFAVGQQIAALTGFGFHHAAL